MLMLNLRLSSVIFQAPLWLMLSPVCFAGGQQPANPFGPNVLLLTPELNPASMQAEVDRIYAQQEHSEFGPGRYAILLMPGSYPLNIPVGFYTQVLGLGLTPDAVRVSGDVHADASLPNNNATCTFWRSAEGFTVLPATGTMQWAVSQGVSLRRMHIAGSLVLDQNHGWASGGWLSDSAIDGTVDSGTQQQWISRNVDWKNWTGANWNMVFVGVNHPPAGQWPHPPYTVVATAPVTREKPFLVYAAGSWEIIVPKLRHHSSGPGWSKGSTPGRRVPLSRFYVAHADSDTSATLNAALKQGKNLLFTPGIYNLTSSLEVTHKDAVVFGLGFATLHASAGEPAMRIADVAGVTVSGLLFEAGVKRSPSLLEVGVAGHHERHASNPISLHDVFFRVGGAMPGSVDADLIVNADDTLIDDTWIWRADHGTGVGWNLNPSSNGLIVNGNFVTAYGLFVEHHQQFQTLWNGEYGRVYFYQSEIPYRLPSQAAWRSAANTNGWASYKVTPNVRHHEAWGLGIYSVFMTPHVTLTRAIEVPRTPGVRFHHMLTTALVNHGAIEHVINNTGATAHPAPDRNTPTVAEYPTSP